MERIILSTFALGYLLGALVTAFTILPCKKRPSDVKEDTTENEDTDNG